MPIAPWRAMRRLLVLPLLITASPLVAQGLRLDERLERPLLYVRLEPPALEARVPGLMRHPVLASLSKQLGADGGAARMVGDLAARAAGAVEIAWTGTLPGRAGSEQGDRPLLLFRAQLDPKDASRLNELLASGEMAKPHRRVGGTQTYLLSSDREQQPGSQVEVVLFDRDLLVSNHGRAVEEVLGAAELDGPALAVDPDFQRLRARLDAGPGAVLVFADVRQLLRRTPWDLRRLQLPRHMLAVVEPKARGVSASLILDSGSKEPLSTSLRLAAAGELLAALSGEGGLVLSMAGEPPRGGRGGRGNGSTRGSGRRLGRTPLEAWERAGRAFGAPVRFEQRGDLRLLRFVPEVEWDPRLAALLKDLAGPREDVLGLFGVTLPVPGGPGVLRLAGTVEPEAGDDGQRLLRVRVVCDTD